MSNKRKEFKSILWNDYDEGAIAPDTFDYFMSCISKCKENELYGLFLGYQYIKNKNLEMNIK